MGIMSSKNAPQSFVYLFLVWRTAELFHCLQASFYIVHKEQSYTFNHWWNHQSREAFYNTDWMEFMFEFCESSFLKNVIFQRWFSGYCVDRCGIFRKQAVWSEWRFQHYFTDISTWASAVIKLSCCLLGMLEGNDQELPELSFPSRIYWNKHVASFYNGLVMS